MKRTDPDKPKLDSLYGIDENTLLEKLYTQSRPLRLWEIETLWPINFTEKTGMIFRLLGVLVNKELVSHTDERTSVNDTWRINEKGKAYLSGLQTEEQRLKEEKDITMRKLRADVVVSEWMKKTYWWTFVLSILGFLLGALGAALSIWR